MDGGSGAGYGPVRTAKKKIVSHEPLRRSSRDRSGLSDQGFDDARITLGVVWKGLILAGKQDAEIDLESEGEHSCAARITLDDETVVDGVFSDKACHAEMDALKNVYTAGYTKENIELIEIEKQPCPRCAVVLNKLHLQNKVKYKTSGQKDYPTWRYPKLNDGHDWAVTMGVSQYAAKDAHQKILLGYFCTNKWWD